MKEGMQRTLRLRILSLAMLMAAAPLVLANESAAAAEYQIRYAGVQGSEDANTKAQKVFKDEVEKASNGRIEVLVYSGQQMAGGNTMDQLRFVKLGALEIVATGLSQLSGEAPNFGAVSMPFLFSSLAEADRVMDGKAGTILANDLERLGLKLLGFQNQGLRNIVTSRKPIRKLDDLAGLKLRVVPGPVSLATYKALAANPVAMDFAEVPGAMTQGVIDGLDLPLTPAVGLRAFSYAKYYTLTQTSFESTVVIMNAAFFRKLPPDLQEIVVAAGKHSIDFQRKQQAEDEANAAEVLRKNGMEIITLPEPDLKLARERVQSVFKEFEAKFSPEILKAIRDRN